LIEYSNINIYILKYILVASQLYVAFSRTWSMAAVNVKVADSHQQSKKGENNDNNNSKTTTTTAKNNNNKQ